MTGAAEAFRQAQAALRDGRPEDAAALFREVSRRAPDDAAALVHLGRIEARGGRRDAAAAAWREAQTRQPSNTTAIAFLSDLIGTGGPSPEQARHYERLRVLMPHHPGTAALLGWLYDATDQTVRSVRRYREAALLDAANPAAFSQLAAALHKSGHLLETGGALKRQVLLDPASQGGWFNLSVIESALGDREQALATLVRSLILRPLDGPASARQAQLLRQIGLPGADIATRKSQIAEPFAERALAPLARMGEPNAAARWWCAMPGSAEAGMLYMRNLLAADRPRQALDILQKIEVDEALPDEILLLAAEAAARTGGDIARLPQSQYHAWLEQLPAPPQTPKLGSRTSAPRFSILLPVYNPDQGHLLEAIRSVRAQSYGDWELCIADDASTNPEIARILRAEAAAEPRIKLAFREENGHISAASNTALDLARGEFLGLLDHDDLLAPQALAEMARAIDAHPELDLLYSDEDKIDANGVRFSPHFKPAWDPDLSLLSNYLCHFTVLRRSRVLEAGGFRKGVEGSQDHDLAQRVAERCGAARIGHVPQILYHWRAAPGSTALSLEMKPYAAEATGRTIRDALERRAENARTEYRDGYWRLVRPLPEERSVSIVIPTRNRLNLLRTCIEGLTDHTEYEGSAEIVIVDNGSDDPAALAYLAALSRRPNVRVLRDDGGFNFSRLNNLAAATASGAFLCFLNNDIEPLSPSWLTEMVAEAARAEVGLVGAKLLYPDRTIQHAGIALCGDYVARHTQLRLAEKDGGYWGRAMHSQNLSAVTGACMVLRREIFEKVGRFDESFAVDFGDIDLCLRVRAAGYRVIWTPHALLIHHESASRGTVLTAEKAALFEQEQDIMVRRWGALLDDDPAYNPNLSVTPERPAYALPEVPRPIPNPVRYGPLPR